MTQNNTSSRGTVVPCKRILLTGATGILGAHLLKELLRQTDAHITCLVRAENRDSAMERLLPFLRVYDPQGQLNEQFYRRVTAQPGDVSEPNMGLSDETYAQLAAETDVTLHAAALTNLFLTYRRIAPVNVGGSKNIIEFALQTKSKYLCHVSTHTVVGDKVLDPRTVFRESDLDIGQGFEHLTYQKTKFEVEHMVRAAKERGLVWNIFRPGQIFGESTTGRYPHAQGTVSGLFYDLFKTVMESGVAMDSDWHFDVVPVDYVSRGIVELALFRGVKYETYHLTNPDIKTYAEVFSLLERHGYRIEWVDQPEYEKRLVEKLLRFKGEEYKSPTTSAFRWWFKRGITLMSSGYTCSKFTAEVLATTGIQCPPIDEKLLGNYLRAGMEAGYFEPLPLGVNANAPAEVTT